MKILVTGGAGYIGSHFAKRVALRGHEVVVLDNLERGRREAVRWGELLEVDLRDRDALIAAVARCRPDAVVHFAALAYVGESMSHPERYYRTNVVGTHNLLDAMLGADVETLVFSSTCATYGEPETLPITEATPQHPVNPYGHSKRMAEEMLGWYGRIHGLRWAALRYFNVIGCDPDAEIGEHHEPEPHLLPRAIRAAMGRGPALTVYGDDYPTPDGTAIRDYVHVWDLAEAHRLALEKFVSSDGAPVCNLGTGRGHSVREVIEAVSEVAGCEVPHAVAERRAGDPPELVADATRARECLGWKPEFVDLRDGVRHAWRWIEGH